MRMDQPRVVRSWDIFTIPSRKHSPGQNSRHASATSWHLSRSRKFVTATASCTKNPGSCGFRHSKVSELLGSSKSTPAPTWPDTAHRTICVFKRHITNPPVLTIVDRCASRDAVVRISERVANEGVLRIKNCVSDLIILYDNCLVKISSADRKSVV